MAKRKKYRLQVVLERKEEAKKEAAIQLAEAKDYLHKQIEEETRLKQELERNRNRRNQEYDAITVGGLSAGFNANQAQQGLNYIKRLDTLADDLRHQITGQQRRVKKAEEEVEEALQVLIQASRELQVMENHKEKWLDKEKREQEKSDQNEMNEIGNAMYTGEAKIGLH